MRIVSVKNLFLVLALSLVSLNITAQSPQSQEELIRKAKAMGATDAMINEQLAKQKKGKNNIVVPKSEQTDRSRTTSETDSISRINNLQTEKEKIFGTNVFSSQHLSFAPNANIATPKDYKLAAGDEVIIDVWGASEANYREKISPDGTIYIQNAGLISLAGLTVEEAEQRLKLKLSEIYSGLTQDSDVVNIKVTLGQIRSIKVNMAGEVKVPGTYTLSSLSTLFNALYAASGVNEIGTLREIKLYRNNHLIKTLDVYDYLLNGNDLANIRLEDNDMIIVSPYQNRVLITGGIKRPAIYELTQNETLKDLLDYAGGFTGDAFSDKLTVTRKNGNESQLFIIENKNFETFRLQDGDNISIQKTIDKKYENKISISGSVWRPGNYALTDKTNSVKGLIQAASGLKGDEFKTRAIITRLLPDSTLQNISFDVNALMAGTSPDIALQTDDKVFIPSVKGMKQEFSISVNGEVNHPNIFHFAENMTVEDAILLAGGFKESASEAKIIVSRIVSDPLADSFSEQLAEEFEFQVSKDLKLGPSATNFALKPFDHVLVRRSPAYHDKQVVSIRGEVLYPGNYVLTKKGERLSSLIERAGGLSPEVYIEGASLKRKRNEDEIAKETALQTVIRNSAFTSDSLMDKVIDVKPEYNVGIDLKAALKHPGGIEDISLQEGDELYIPELKNTIKINGAVLYPNSTVFKKNTNLKDYISQAGGYAQNARKRPYVIYMNGQVGATKRFLWIKRYPKIEPGCEIVVPLKQEMPRQRLSFGETVTILSTLTSTAAIIFSITK